MFPERPRGGVVHAVLGKGGMTGEFVPKEQPSSDKIIRRYAQGISSEGRRGAVGRVAEGAVRHGEGKDLPDGLAGTGKVVNEIMGRLSQVSRPVPPGKGRDGQKDAACSVQEKHLRSQLPLSLPFYTRKAVHRSLSGRS